MSKQPPKEIINRKAKYEYHFIQEIEAGISLVGTEVKSVRNGNANMSDAYCLIKDGQVILKNFFIGEYEHGNINNHEPKRDRVLLLKRPEIKKIERKIKEKGLTLIPYKVYFSERGFIKALLVLAQGKKTYDKRESLKEKDNKRMMDRVKKMNN
jgi:SsrA-binding protein